MTNAEIIAALNAIQSDLDDELAELKQTTVGFINKKWKIPPAGSHWSNGLVWRDAATIKLQDLIKALAPAPPPPPPTTTVSDFAGLCIYNKAVSQGDPQKIVDLFGCKHVRVDWPSKAWCDKLRNLGINFIPICDYAQGMGVNGDHSAPNDYAKYADKVVNTYINDWGLCPAIEIWNEPWGSGFWTNPNPVEYLKLVIAIATAIWKINPKCRIIVASDATGSINVTGTDKWRVNLLAADTNKFLTNPLIWPTTHNYCNNRSPSTRTSSPNSWDYDRYEGCYNDYKAHGHPDPKVFVGEAGWETNEGTNYNGTVTDAQQASYVSQAIDMAMASGKVNAICWYYLQTGNNWSYNFLHVDNTPKPVCATLKAKVSA